MKKFFCFVFLLSLFISCKSKKEKISPVVENISESVYASGIIKSRNQYQVFSTVNGLIQQILVTEGDMVKKGTSLFKILNETSKLNRDNAQLAADFANENKRSDKLNELKINIDFAKIKMENDGVLLQRQKNLWEQNIGTKNELDQRELSYKNSVTNYQAAKLRMNDLQKQMDFSAKQSQKTLQISSTISGDYTIKSEREGKVYSILKEQGEMVNTQTPVAVIGDAADFYLELQIDELDIAKIKPGQKVILNLDSYKGEVFEARVEKINPIMNERSRSFIVEAAFVTKPAVLYPNLTTEANVVIQTKDKALTIPRNYLVEDSFVLDKDENKVPVTVGLRDYKKAEILKGLKATDIILKPAK